MSAFARDQHVIASNRQEDVSDEGLSYIRLWRHSR